VTVFKDELRDCGIAKRRIQMNEKAELTMGRPRDALTNEKLTVYLDVISLFTSFTDPKIQRQVAKSPQKQEAMGQQIAKIGMRLALIGADSVVKGYCEFRELSQLKGAKSEDIVRSFGDLMLRMRVDLYGTQACDVNDMLGSFIVGKM